MMRKIRLDADALAVESFVVANHEETPAGTVQAYQGGVPTLETGIHGCYGCLATGLPTCRGCS
jgi:hypothetical protein